MDEHQRIVMTARAFLRRLVDGRYDELEFLSENNFPQEEIRYALEDYDATPIEPSPEFDILVDISEIENIQPREWSVIFPLWTVEEGRSDLSVSMTCLDSEKSDGTFDFELNGIYVP